MESFRKAIGLAGALLAAACWAACAPEEDPARPRVRREADPDAAANEPIPGGELPDEQFPKSLLEPYDGPPIDDYDNTFIRFPQLKARLARVFADASIGGNTETYLAEKLALLGGVDFKTTFNEARVASSDFLLALDAIAKDACGRAATNKTGPFAGSDPANVGANANALATQLYQRMLFRGPTPAELGEATKLVATLTPLSTNATSAWAGLCEALVRHPDAIFTLPPSVDELTGADKQRMQLVKLTMDFLGRPPTDAEFTSLTGQSTDAVIDALVAAPEFKSFFFHRARLRLESAGTAETDEPARLWAHLAATGAPFQELLTADYSIDEGYAKQARGTEHGKTGVLTMPGFIKGKPGLPHYNYAARVLSDFMGQMFVLTPDIVTSRATAASTVDPQSSCYGCHYVLTPLETQRLRWADDGTYRTNDESGMPLDDSDRGMVPSYPYKGKGMEAFATQAVKKERFLLQSFQAPFLFFIGRPMRWHLDERTMYLALWKKAFAANGDIRALLKVIATTPGYLGK